MSYRFGKLWHLAIIWAIRKSFQCILQGVRFLLAKQTRLSWTSDNVSYRAGGPPSQCCYTLLLYYSTCMLKPLPSWLFLLISWIREWSLSSVHGVILQLVPCQNEASNAVFTALQVSGLNETAVVKNFPYEIWLTRLAESQCSQPSYFSTSPI